MHASLVTGACREHPNYLFYKVRTLGYPFRFVELFQLRLEFQFRLGEPVESDAPLAGHRSRHLRLPIVHAHRTSKGR